MLIHHHNTMALSKNRDHLRAHYDLKAGPARKTPHRTYQSLDAQAGQAGRQTG